MLDVFVRCGDHAPLYNLFNVILKNLGMFNVNSFCHLHSFFARCFYSFVEFFVLRKQKRNKLPTTNYYYQLKTSSTLRLPKKPAQFFTLKRFGPEKCPVYLRVPWIKKPSTNLEKEVKAAMIPSASAWSLRQSAFCLWPARMFYLPLRKVLSYMNVQ